MEFLMRKVVTIVGSSFPYVEASVGSANCSRPGLLTQHVAAFHLPLVVV